MKLLPLARLSLGALLALSGALWVGALVSSSRATPPALLAYGEPVARRGATWPVRVVAVWPSERRTALVEGSVSVGGAQVPLERGVARAPLPREGNEATVVLEGTAAGSPVRLSLDVRLARTWPEGVALRYEPWTREVVPKGAGASGGPPVYPLPGRVSASLPTSVLVLREEGYELTALPPNAAGVTLEDKRTLRTDASGLRVTVPVAVRPGEELDAEVAFAFDPPSLHLDLVVNGIVRDFRVVSGNEREKVRFTLPDDISSGWFAVRASPSPLPALPSASALGIVLGEGDPQDPVSVLRQVAKLPGFRDGSDPLLKHLVRTPPDGLEPIRALLGRLRADDVRAPNLAPTGREQAAQADDERARAVARFRLPFRVSGTLFALLAALVALVSARDSGRWQELPADPVGDTDTDASGRSTGDTGDTGDTGGMGGMGDTGLTAPRRLPSLGWALLAFGASLSTLWVLDWVIGLTLGGGGG